MADDERGEANQNASERANDASGRLAFTSIFGRLRHLITSAARSKPELKGIARLLLMVAIIVLAASILLWIADKFVFYYVTRSYVDEVASVFDLNKHLANALVLLTFVAVVAFARLLWSLSKRKRIIGISGIAALLMGHSLVLWHGTRGSFFDRSGNAVKCYVLTRDGRVTYGIQPGVDPLTGRLCRHVTADMLERLQQYEAGKRPQPIADQNPVFFDQRSGEPIIWYSQTRDSTIEIFDLMGFHPDTGEELKPISKEVVAQWRKQRSEELRRIPKSIPDPSNYVFFDPRNGVAKAWYWIGPDGHYEFYDASGFQPQTGDKLIIVTPNIVAQWKEKQRNPTTPKRVPSRVQISENTVFFDPVTGSPLLWYWRRDRGDYEFFDGPGFDPQNGQSLQSFSKEALTRYQVEITEKAKELKIEQERITAEQEAKRKEAAKKQLAEKEKEDAEEQKRAKEAQRRTEAARRCDELAANPNDARRVGAGVSYSELKPLATEAAEVCEVATEQNPNELRFRYQLARALELIGEGQVRAKNRQRALQIHETLVRQDYAAAFDNLGSLYGWDRKDIAAATALFRKGAALGDSDSMISLADLIESHQVVSDGPNETPLELYKRAAELGNQNGIRAFQTEAANVQRAEQERLQQLETQRLMLQFMGTVLRNVPNQ